MFFFFLSGLEKLFYFLLSFYSFILFQKREALLGGNREEKKGKERRGRGLVGNGPGCMYACMYVYLCGWFNCLGKNI